MMTMDRVRTVLLAAALLVIPVAGTVAMGQDDAASHLAKGEVQYDHKWITIQDLFGLYEAAQKDLAGLVEKTKAAQAHIAELTKQDAKIVADYTKDKRVLDTEMAKIRAAGYAANARYLAPAPVRPWDPGNNAPNRGAYQNDAQYQAAVNYWNNARNNYQQRLNDYNQQLAQWTTAHNAAKAEIDKQIAAEKDCLKRLADRLAARNEAETPVKTERQKTTDEMRAIQTQAGSIQAKLKIMADSLRTAPESKRLALGIVEYREEFYSLAEFQAMVDKVNADIESARQKFKEGAGGVVPASWRHPKQDEADAMAVVLAKAKAGAGKS